MNDIDGRPQWQIDFDENGAVREVVITDAHGAVTNSRSIDAILAEAGQRGVTDLVLFSHGWNNDQASASSLYAAMFPLIGSVAKAHAPEMFAGLGYLGVFWPSTWFADEGRAVEAALRGGGGGGGGGDARWSAGDALSSSGATAPPPGGGDLAGLTGEEVAAQVREAFPESVRDAVARIGELIDDGLDAAAVPEDPAHERARILEIAALLEEVTGPWPTPAELDAIDKDAPNGLEEQGERRLFLVDSDAGPPKDDVARAAALAARFERFGDKLGAAPPKGDAQFSFSDLNPAKIYHGIKGSVRFASFFQMKARAGVVGEKGVGRFLARLAETRPDVRVHLVGHSFGARVVSYSLKGLASPDASPVHSLTLIQGAFSHWTFADPQPWGHPGELSAFADRVHGPLVAIFSQYDRAVGAWYPLASLMNESDAQASIANDRWGGMGSDGFQRARDPLHPVGLKDPGLDYGLAAGTFYSVNGARAIRRSLSAFSGAHSDIRHPEVAWVVVSAARGGSAG
jgi:hypothetical protein